MLLSGCARSTPPAGDRDPYQPINRKMQSFNDGADKIVFRPVTKAYVFVIPGFARKGVRNVFDNLDQIGVFINSFLQGRLKRGASDLGRFATNTTLGVLGLFDVATRLGLPRHEADLGLTLAAWGCGEGNYYVLPLLGPSTTRDNSWQVIQGVLGVASAPWSLLDLVSMRAAVDADMNAIDSMAVDRYIFLREAYRQHRNYLITDGKSAPLALEPEAASLTPPDPEPASGRK